MSEFITFHLAGNIKNPLAEVRDQLVLEVDAEAAAKAVVMSVDSSRISGVVQKDDGSVWILVGYGNVEVELDASKHSLENAVDIASGASPDALNNKPRKDGRVHTVKGTLGEWSVDLDFAD